MSYTIIKTLQVVTFILTNLPYIVDEFIRWFFTSTKIYKAGGK